MAFWKSPHLSTNQGGWTTVENSLLQHKQLLEVGGFPCKVLHRKIAADSIGDPVSPIDISSWDELVPAPKKVIWTTSSEDYEFPDPRTVVIYVDGEELTQVYDSNNITSDSEFYIVSEVNLVGVNDNVAIYLNDGFDTTNKDVAYYYNNIAKGVNTVETSQPIDLPSTYRTEFVDGFTQYINPNSTFRGVTTPNTLLVSFPASQFDTVYMGQGRYEQIKSTCWTVGDRLDYPLLKEYDILYRVDLDRWFEVRNYTPNYMQFGGNVILLTQIFEAAEISPHDTIKTFELL